MKGEATCWTWVQPATAASQPTSEERSAATKERRERSREGSWAESVERTEEEEERERMVVRTL